MFDFFRFKFDRGGVGRLGEKIARRYYLRQGYKIIERNLSFFGRKKQLGELDFVALRGAELVFVEVRTRVGELTDNALVSDVFYKVGSAKRGRIVDCAFRFIRKHNKGKMFSFKVDLCVVILDGNSSFFGSVGRRVETFRLF